MTAKRIGIECHNLEGKRFGVGQTLIQLLQSLAENKEVASSPQRIHFILYFNKQIPNDPILSNPIFEKKLLKFPFLPPSFNIFYHILLPIAYFKDRLDGFFLVSYMMPAFFMGSPPHLFIYNIFRYLLNKISFNYISLPEMKSRCGGKSIAVLTNDVYYESYYGNLPFKYKIAYRIFSWLAAKRSNKVLSISKFSKKELSKLYKISPEKISVISWSLNEDIKKLDKSSENIQKIKDIKQRLGVKDKFILSVGQAFPRRKVKECILAFEKIADKIPGVQYIVASVDKYNPPIIDDLIKNINNRLGRSAIIRANYLSQDDILHLFNNTELLIYISSNEAQGLPPMEALKCGSVPLVADNDLTREMLDDNAFFVKDIDSIDSIATEMQSALTDKKKREKIIQSGPAAMQKFSWPEYSDKLIKLFKEVF